MRISASRATLRASAAKAFAGLRMGAVPPRRRVLRTFGLRLNRDEFDDSVTRADARTVDDARIDGAVAETRAQHLQALPSKGRPRAAETHESMHVDRRLGPVDLQ